MARPAVARISPRRHGDVVHSNFGDEEAIVGTVGLDDSTRRRCSPRDSACCSGTFVVTERPRRQRRSSGATGRTAAVQSRPGVRGCGPAPTSAMVPFDRVFPTRSYGGLTAVPGSCAAARTRRTNFASRVSRGTSAVAHIGLAAGHHLHVLGVGSTARSSGPSEFPPRRETHALWQLLSVLASRRILPGTG